MAIAYPDSQLDTLLNPTGAFAHPNDVVRDPDLTLREKRAILSSWASDACAVEPTPALRQLATSVKSLPTVTPFSHPVATPSECLDWAYPRGA